MIQGNTNSPSTTRTPTANGACGSEVHWQAFGQVMAGVVIGYAARAYQMQACGWCMVAVVGACLGVWLGSCRHDAADVPPEPCRSSVSCSWCRRRRRTRVGTGTSSALEIELDVAKGVADFADIPSPNDISSAVYSPRRLTTLRHPVAEPTCMAELPHQRSRRLVFEDMHNRLLCVVVHIMFLAAFEPLFYALFVRVEERREATRMMSEFLEHHESYVTRQYDSMIRRVSAGNAMLGAIVQDQGSRAWHSIVSDANVSCTAEVAGHRSMPPALQSIAQELAIYVAIMFVCYVFALRIKRVRVFWGAMIVENLLLIMLLGLYEYTFFTRVILKDVVMDNRGLNVLLGQHILKATKQAGVIRPMAHQHLASNASRLATNVSHTISQIVRELGNTTTFSNENDALAAAVAIISGVVANTNLSSTAHALGLPGSVSNTSNALAGGFDGSPPKLC